jgi:CDP-paratose 2-epimerase
MEARWDYDDPEYEDGISEEFPVDQSLHSLFGASKFAADVMTQEYGRYFGIKTGVFRGGCLTGPHHAGVKLHGFLNYLIYMAMKEGDYTVYGYRGKQVRDQIHSHDVISAFWQFAQNPRPGEVCNLGGGKANVASLIECVAMIEDRTGMRPQLVYSDQNRKGDHICYHTDLSKLHARYPEWRMTYALDQIIDEMIELMGVS